jgi:hypothetical protein
MQFDEKFRKTDQYNELMHQIEKLNPDLPLYFKELCMMAHIGNPHLYKEERQKNKNKNKKVEVVDEKEKQSIYNTVEIISPL